MFNLPSNTSRTSECNTRIDSDASGACHAKLLEIQVGSHKCYSYRRKSFIHKPWNRRRRVRGQKRLTALAQHCTDMRRFNDRDSFWEMCLMRFRRCLYSVLTQT